MFDTVGQVIFDQEIIARSSDFTMGIEVEMHRIDEHGRLSHQPYPVQLGDQNKNQFIKNDFVQTQSEVITPPVAHSVAAMNYLMALNNTLRQALQPDEMLWPLSMPPALPKDKTQIPIADVEPAKLAYFQKWVAQHGYVHGLPTGAHLNISIDQHVFDLVYPKVKDHFESRTAVENAIYLKVAQQFVRYRWILIYLFGASPIAEANYFEPDDPDQPKQPVRSLRNSHYGFDSHFTGNYTSVDQYVQTILDGVKAGQLLAPMEFHGSVRLKGTGDFEKMPETGVDYLELRFLDLDPTTSVGVRTEAVRFIRLMMSYFMLTPGIPTDQVAAKLAEADRRCDQIALENPFEQTAYHDEAQAFLDKLQLFGDQIQWGPEYQEVMDTMQDRLDHPGKTPAAFLAEQVRDGSLTDFALRIAERYQKHALRNIRPFKGFADKPTLDEGELRQNLFKGNWEPRN